MARLKRKETYTICVQIDRVVGDNFQRMCHIKGVHQWAILEKQIKNWLRKQRGVK